MYRLYGAPGRASAAPEAVLEELRVPYEFADVDLDDPARVADYRRVNPRGLVPLLVDGERAIAESAAICIYLADRHPEGKLAPAIAAPERGAFLQWMFYLSNTLQTTYMRFIYPARYTAAADGAAGVAADAGTRIAAMWQDIETALASQPFLAGAELTTCDIYLYMLSTWHREAIVPLARFARVTELLARVGERPGVVRMMVRNAGK